jgi:hypothetical protein
MSMLDVARYLSYSRSVDVASDGERFFNLTMANTTHLFSCLYGNRSHWCFGRQEEELMDRPPSKGSRG